MAPEAAGEGEEQDVGFCVGGGVEGQLKCGESLMVDVGAYLSFGVLVETVDGLPAGWMGGPMTSSPSSDIVLMVFRMCQKGAS